MITVYRPGRVPVSINRLTWSEAEALVGEPLRAHAMLGGDNDDENDGVLLVGRSVPFVDVPSRRHDAPSFGLACVHVPESMLDGEGGQALPDRHTPTDVAHIAILERDLRDAATLLEGVRAQLARSESARMILAGQLTEFIELARTAHRYMPEITKMQAITRDALLEQAADAETALRATQGAADGEA